MNYEYEIRYRFRNVEIVNNGNESYLFFLLFRLIVASQD